jgi:hypothetical protein
LSQAVGGGRGPVRTLDPGDRGIRGLEAEQPSLLGNRVGERERRRDRGLVLRHEQCHAVQSLALDGALPAEQVFQDEGDPVVLARRGILLPLAVLAAQALALPSVEGLKVRPFGREHRDGQERAAYLDQA